MNIQDYVTFSDNGEPIYDTEKFKADLDRERNNASQTSRTNTEKKMRETIESEVRARVEEEAKLSAEEKLKRQMEEIVSARQDLYRERIRVMYSQNDLFSEDEIETFMTLVTDDYEASCKQAETLINARKVKLEEYRKNVVSNIQANQPNVNSGKAKPESSIAVKKAQSINSRKGELKEINFN